MELVGEYIFGVPQQMVWEVLQDPRALSLIIPMAKEMKQVADNQYTGSLLFRVGTIAGMFHGKIELFNLQSPISYDIKVQGGSPAGQVDIVGAIRLQPNGDETIMFYNGKINFGGRIASVGSRVMEYTVRALIQESFDTLNRYLSIKHKTTKH